MRSIRQCYVCSLPVPSDDVSGWEVFKEGGMFQFRCPKHRCMAPKQLATIGEALTVKLKFNALYGKFGSGK